MADTTFAFTSSLMPANEQVLEESAIPWGCVMTPGATQVRDVDAAPFQLAIARCTSCGGYINKHCTWGTGWSVFCF